MQPVSLSFSCVSRVPEKEISEVGASRVAEDKLNQAVAGMVLKYRFDLSSRVHLIQDTLTEWLPQADRQAANIFKACLKTAVLISVIAGAIFARSILSLASSIMLSVSVYYFMVRFYYADANCKFNVPEERIHLYGTPPAPGPWFCPNMYTLKGIIAVGSVVWPVITSPFLPLVEACTRKSRWEAVFKEQNTQLGNAIPSFCAFYKQYGQRLMAQLNERIQAAQNFSDKSEKESWEEALKLAHVQMAFLRHFDPEVPDFRVVNPAEQTLSSLR